MIDPTAYPWRAICSIVAQGLGADRWGTGWLASRSTVVTAAHNVSEGDARATRVFVCPGRLGDTYPNGWDITTEIHLVRPQADAPVELAVLHLPQPIGERLGYLATRAVSDDDLVGARLQTAGFPTYVGARLLALRGNLKRPSEDRLYYDIECHEGQSGSPVFLDNWEPGGIPTVVCVHLWGTDLSPSDLVPPAWSGLRMNDRIIGALQALLI